MEKKYRQVRVVERGKEKVRTRGKRKAERKSDEKEKKGRRKEN